MEPLLCSFCQHRHYGTEQECKDFHHHFNVTPESNLTQLTSYPPKQEEEND